MAARMRGRKKKVTQRELMDLERFEALKELAVSLGWTVTVAKSLEGRGGNCLVRGERRAIIASRVPIPERIELLADALRREDLDSVYVRPDLRALLGDVVEANQDGARAPS